MASIETGAHRQVTTETSGKWSSKLTRYVSGSGAVAIKYQAKVDVALRVFMFVFSMIGVVLMATSKQSATMRISPDMTIGVNAKFTHLASFTYFVTAFSTIGLYSIITGYLSYSALKNQQSSRNQQLQFLLLDSLILSISASAMGAGGGVAYEALKGNPHVHWMKICHIFDKFCHQLASAGAMSLLTSMTILMLIWFSICSIAKNSGR
ncbi:hypothetical protein SSX86_014983 [Deinandra increscens subsp. villosa]|uniref:CASP-like protein n=1 Tax=Deinandra increscens subsp. villosa TaxID=3103831 RepID=A0AAP0D4B2_9ASTR